MEKSVSKKAEQTLKKARVKYPIGVKLVVIITVLLLVSLGTITFLVSAMVSSDVRITAEDNNFTVNRRSATEAENKLNTVRSNVFLLLDMLNAAGSSAALSRQASAFFFERNQDIAAVVIPGSLELVNTRFFVSNEIETTLITLFLQNEAAAVRRAVAGEPLLINAAPVFGVPVIAMLYPWQESGYEQAVVTFFSSEDLTESFGSGANSSFMVNDQGDVLVHADYNLVRAGANMANTPIVQAMQESGDRNLQLLYTDQEGNRFFSAFRKISIGDAAVITSIEYNIVFEGIAATTRRNIFLTAAVLFAAILFIWFFSKTISSPVRVLAAAAGQIEQGNFEINLKAKTQDELGLLTDSFVNMSRGLAERERLKDTFGRFINKDIAEKAMKGELTLGGETKHVTIFFSDIRSFTAISEKLEPHEIVGFLNDYMTRMVRCVNDTNGVVDKFIGDAVMAVWGAPISAGSPMADALNCVRSALMMRAALLEFNEGRGGEKKPIIKIGCGINTGDVVAGQIGSSERMEYTVIGDAVNLASRTEALNKPLGTDILITENTYNLIKDYLIVEEMPSVTVKGKEKPVRMFAVVNIPDANDIPGAGAKGPRTLAEVRNLLGIKAPDMNKVDTDAEEQKYKIQES
ncbi:adenylate/guanylate cyclase domain-containing protein [Breznakiella homolactica]|uniref:HAMP domain-containing protein n=1 Tax=Breznakiella homolactica TaxID=2798577 RepID=A0A7T7XR91_9SPIR|nr:adenylate/guanylate cyclase domain-containing protein [Breznakiella homolactica]QQO10933.1 HAMP domain-containing protein [Breznakiella homolactica]